MQVLFKKKNNNNNGLNYSLLTKKAMCGFVGFLGDSNTQRDEGVLHAMTDAIRHRGPDDARLLYGR